MQMQCIRSLVYWSLVYATTMTDTHTLLTFGERLCNVVVNIHDGSISYEPF